MGEGSEHLVLVSVLSQCSHLIVSLLIVVNMPLVLIYNILCARNF